MSKPIVFFETTSTFHKAIGETRTHGVCIPHYKCGAVAAGPRWRKIK